MQKPSYARGAADRYYPDAAITPELQTLMDKLDDRVEMLFDGRVATLYMEASKIIKDPGKPESFFGGTADLARLILANGLKKHDGTVVAYDAKNPEIATATKDLAAELRELFFPRTYFIKLECDRFEEQKKIVMDFLKSSKEPFPKGKFFAQVIAEKTRQNVLPLYLGGKARDPRDQMIWDYLTIKQREAFAELNRIVDSVMEVMAPVLKDRAPNTAQAPQTAPTRPAKAGKKSTKPRGNDKK